MGTGLIVGLCLAAPANVIAARIECESVSLSRMVPAVVRYVVGPLIDRTPKESMTRTLEAVRIAIGS